MKVKAGTRLWTILITMAAILVWLLAGPEHGIFLLLLALLVKLDSWQAPQAEPKMLTDSELELILAKRRQARTAE